MTTKDTILLSLFLAAIPAGLYFLLWDPLFTGKGFDFYNPATVATSINAYRGQIGMYGTTISQSKDIISKFQRLQMSYKGVDKSIITTVQKSIPDTVEELPLVSEVTTLVEKNGLDPGKVIVAPGPDLNGVKTLTLTFHVKGTYETIKSLVVALEENLRFMSVRSFKLIAPTVDVTTSIYTADFTVDVYKLR